MNHLALPNNGGIVLMAAIFLVWLALMIVLAWSMRPFGHSWCRAGHPHRSRGEAEACDARRKP